MRATGSSPQPPRRVDEPSARLVADWFRSARCQPDDPIVRHAYAQLSAQADRWYAHLTGPRNAAAVRVVFTDRSDPYSDASELSESVRLHRVLQLVPARHDDRRHPLLDNAVGGAQDRLRAVHDIVSHGWHRHDFTRDGEFSAWLVEDTMYTGLARWALATELHGHHSVRWTTGELAPYKAALIDAAVLSQSVRASRASPVAGFA